MWADFVAWANLNLPKCELALASAAELKIPQCVYTADQAITPIR